MRRLWRGVAAWVGDLASPCDSCGTRIRERQLWIDPARIDGKYAFAWWCRPCHESHRYIASAFAARRAR